MHWLPSWPATPRQRLQHICEIHGLDMDQGMKKAELVSYMARQLPGRYARQVNRLEEDQLDILLKVYRSENMVPLQDFAGDTTDVDIIRCCLENLLLFPGAGRVGGKENVGLCLPREIRQVLDELEFSQVRAKAARHGRWMELTQGLLYYYGAAEYPVVLDEVRRLSGQQIDEEDYLDVLALHMSWYRDSCNRGPVLIHGMVLDPDLVWGQIEESVAMRGITHRKLSRKQVLDAARKQYDHTEAFARMKRFITENYGLRDKEATTEVEGMLFLMDSGMCTAELYEEMSERFDLSDEQVMEDYLMLSNDLYNHHRQWILLGYSPSVLMEKSISGERSEPVNVFADPVPSAPKAVVYDFAKKRKVGRNDPCPCGSGKEYKKCCGR